MATKSLPASSTINKLPAACQVNQKPRFLACRVCGQGVLLAPTGATARTRYTCRRCTPNPESFPHFETLPDDPDVRDLTRRYEQGRRSCLEDPD